MKCPKIRVSDESGLLVVRDGFIATFFMRASHSEIGPSAAVAFERYIKIVGEDKLKWIAGADQWEAVGNQRIDDVRKEMRDAKENWTSHIDLVDSDEDPPKFRFYYNGKCLSDPTFESWDSAVSTVNFWFSTEFIESRGFDSFRQEVISIGEALPFNTGYGSMAFVYSEGDSELAAFSAIRQLAFRYPGFDVYDLLQSGFLAGTQVRGAYWLNFLGPPVLDEMGGFSSIQSKITNDLIKVEKLDSNKCLVTLGPEPECGDVNRKQDLPLHQELSKAIEGFLSRNIGDFSRFSSEDTERWRRRFLD